MIQSINPPHLPEVVVNHHQPAEYLKTIYCKQQAHHQNTATNRRTGRVERVVDAVQARILDEEEKQETPFFIVDLYELEGLYGQWVLTLPNIKPFYAIKCNPDSALIAELAALGAGFDCATLKEMEHVLKLGVPPNRIIFAHPCKSPAHIRFAKRHQVKRMTFDNADELEKIHSIYPSGSELVLRIATEDAESGVPFSKKFGCRIDKARELIEKAAELELNLVGVSFHVGSSCNNDRAYEIAIKDARYVFDVAYEVTKKKLTLLDLGGGYPGRNEPTQTNFQSIAGTIKRQLAKYFYTSADRSQSIGSLEIIAEPGRYFAYSTFTLAAQIHSRRLFASTNPEETANMYYINDGVYGSFMDIKLTDFKPTYRVVRPPTNTNTTLSPRKVHDVKLCGEGIETYPSCVWGPTGDSIDLVLKNQQLPILELGDWLIFENMGAYSTAISTEFNGCEKADIYHINYS